MMQLLHKFNVQDGEERLITLLFLHSFFNGGAMVFGFTASSALFLEAFGSENLAYAYIGRAFIVALTGLLIYWLQPKVSQNVFVLGSLGILLVTAVFLWLGLILTSLSLFIILLFVWFRQAFLMTNFTFWRLAGRLMTLPQAKRLFGLIGSGELIVRVIGYALVPFIVAMIGTRNMMLLTALCVAASLLVLIMLLRYVGQQESEPVVQQGKAAQKTHPDTKLYTQLIGLLTAVGMIVYIFVDFGFYQQLGLRYQDADALSRIIAYIHLVIYVLSIVARTVFGPWVVRRFGVREGLLILPITVAASVVLVILIDTVFGFTSLILAVVVFVKVMDETFRMGNSPIALLLFQPLSKQVRGQAQAQNDIIMIPIASAVGGLLLLALRGLEISQTAVWTIPVIFYIIGWIMLTVLVAYYYRQTLRNALAQRMFNDNLLTIDHRSLHILFDKLNSKHSGEVVHALELLGKWGTAKQQQQIMPLLTHPNPLVQGQVLDQIMLHEMDNTLPRIMQQLPNFSDERVQARAVEAVCKLGDYAQVQAIQTRFPTPPFTIQRGMLIGMLHNDDLRKNSENHLFTLQKSPQPQDRQLVAEVIGATALDDYSGLLLPLFEDDTVAVRQAAIVAAGKLDESILWPRIIDALSDVHIQPMALYALTQVGPSALPLIDRALRRAPLKMAHHLMQVVGQIGGEDAQKLLLRQLSVANVSQNEVGIMALQQSGFVAKDQKDVTFINKQIQAEMAYVMKLWGLLRDFSVGDSEGVLDPLKSAILTYIVQSRARIFRLLTFLFDPKRVRQIEYNLSLQNPERQAYALELMDILLPRDLHAFVSPLLAVLPSNLRQGSVALLRLQGLNRPFPQPQFALTDRLTMLVDPAKRDMSLPDWLVVCGLYAIGRLNLTQLTHQIQHHANHAQNPYIKTQAQWAATQLHVTDHENAPLSLVERVGLLKQSDLFAQIPDDQIANIANIMQEVTLEADQVLFKKGETGNAMYFIISGQVKAHDGDFVYNQIDERNIVGEMSALDPAPRSATITAVKETRLLSLGQPNLQRVLQRQPQIGKGIITVLTRRLRQRAQDVSQLQAQMNLDDTVVVDLNRRENYDFTTA